MAEFEQVCAFDDTLAPGKRVLAKWTESGQVKSGEGSIVRVNTATVRVRLDSGLEVTVRRFGETLNAMKRWSWNNGVFPLPF